MEQLVLLFNRFLNTFVAPGDLQRGTETLHARAQVGLLLISFFILLFCAGGLWLFYPLSAEGREITVLAGLAMFLLLLAALFAGRYPRSQPVATHLLIISSYLPVTLAVAATGGISSPIASLLVWSPIIAGFLFDWKIGLSWMALTVFTAIGFFAAPYLGVDLTSIVPAENLSRLHFAMLLINLIGIGGFIIVYTLINHNVVNELADQRREFKRLANYDVLTALPNRMHFHHELHKIIQNAQRTGEHVGLLVMDLNNFKSINDRYGHSVGDKVLHHVARRLIEHVRDTDFVARLSGDEFVVIMEHVSHAADVAAKAAALIKIIEQPYGLSIGRMQLGLSIGAAVYPDQEIEEAALFTRADMAMFYAKRNKLGFYMDQLAGDRSDYMRQLESSAEREPA